MTLPIWLENGFLKRHETSNEELGNLREVVKTKLADAAVEQVSLDNRVHSLYFAALNLCRIALHASGYRARPGAGQHEYTIRSLVLTMGDKWRDSMEIFNQARAARVRGDYESVGTATLSQMQGLREEVEKLLPEVAVFVRSRGYTLT